MLNRYLLVFLLLFLSNIFAKTNEIESLLEKINQTSNPLQKKELIEKLKKKLANKNKKARQESDAIIKAKKKMPVKLYHESSIEK